MVFKRLFNTFTFMLFRLKPLIEEVAGHGCRVVYLSEQEVEKLIIQIVNGIELVHKCSKVPKNAKYKKYKCTLDKILDLHESLQELFIELKGQVEKALKEAMDSANKIEMAIKKIEDKTLTNILSMQGQRDVAKEEIGVVDDSTRNVEETMDLLDEENSESEPTSPTVLSDEAAKMETDCMRRLCLENDASQRREAEMTALHKPKENKKLGNVLVGPVRQYRKFTWEEIVSATSSFSEDLKIGKGPNGTVYKSNFRHTTAAVKVLHSKEKYQTKEFFQELEILSQLRHPHLLLLLGACPDHGCLVYEYMENGNLDDRLSQKNNTPSIPWYERFRIVREIASALVFLHSSEQKPIFHRALKPANILLDHNLVSKIGDVGFSTMLHIDPSVSSIYNETRPVRTRCYIDPEYQPTGVGVFSTKSDVYALGVVILQLLTAKPAMAITRMVKNAIYDRSLKDVLDPKAGSWPMEEARHFAELGLRCVKLRRRDRPDLKEQVIPALDKLKEVADKARDSASIVRSVPTS